MVIFSNSLRVLWYLLDQLPTLDEEAVINIGYQLFVGDQQANLSADFAG